MSIYQEYRREPSVPHQCFHHSDKDGARCRGRAMHNEVMCFHHRVDDIPTVLQNSPYELTSLYDRAAIQHAVTEVAARLAANQMDLKRATLLLQSCKIAAANLTAHERAAREEARTAANPGAPCSTNSTMGIPPTPNPAELQNAVPFTPPFTELDPNPDPEALTRYQAYRAELGLDEEPDVNPQNPFILSEASRPYDAQSKDPHPSSTIQSPDTILPTLTAAAAPWAARSAQPQSPATPPALTRSVENGTKYRSVENGMKYRSVENGTKCRGKIQRGDQPRLHTCATIERPTGQ